MAQRLISASCDSLCVFKTFARVTAESHSAQGSKTKTDPARLCVPKIRKGSTTYSPSSQEGITTNVIEEARAVEKTEDAPRPERDSHSFLPGLGRL